MKAEYKKFIISGLYGLMEGSAKSLESHLRSYFKMRYGFEADEITVIESNRRFASNGCWIGAMTATIAINGETFTWTRDWGEEYEIDVKHPDYHSDDWFYEGEKCHSYSKHKEAMDAIDNEILKVKDWKNKEDN